MSFADPRRFARARRTLGRWAVAASVACAARPFPELPRAFDLVFDGRLSPCYRTALGVEVTAEAGRCPDEGAVDGSIWEAILVTDSPPERIHGVRLAFVRTRIACAGEEAYGCAAADRMVVQAGDGWRRTLVHETAHVLLIRRGKGGGHEDAALWRRIDGAGRVVPSRRQADPRPEKTR